MNWTKFRITRYKKKFPNCPENLLNILVESADRFLTIDEAQLFRNQNVQSKRKIKSNCNICKEDFTIGLTKWLKRKYSVSICRKCYVPKFVTKQKDWLDSQSQCQIIAQNRQEVKVKISESIKKMWKENPEKLEQMRQKIIKKIDSSSNYRDAILGSNNRGYIHCRFGKIRFDSLAELMFIIQCDKDNKIVSLTRWNKPGIIYEGQTKTKRYYPDFVVDEKLIIDIKSGFVQSKDENLNNKILATKNNYPLFDVQIISPSTLTTYKFKNLIKLNYNIEFSHKYKQILYENGIKLASSFQKQISEKSEFTKLKSKRIIHYKGQVHDLKVSTPDRSYIVNNIVVHNSAAGSLVCYLLDITNIDPIKHGLLFERFLSMSRSMAIYDLSVKDIEIDENNLGSLSFDEDDFNNWFEEKIINFEE